MALGASLAESNPLKANAFREEDIRWARMSEISRSISRLSVYSTALTDLLIRADDLGIKPEDRALIQSLLLLISELFLKHLELRFPLFVSEENLPLIPLV